MKSIRPDRIKKIVNLHRQLKELEAQYNSLVQPLRENGEHVYSAGGNRVIVSQQSREYTNWSKIAEVRKIPPATIKRYTEARPYIRVDVSYPEE